MKRSIVIVAMVAVTLALACQNAVAQSGMTENGPVFESDIKKKAEQDASELAERRKTYGDVTYPKFMQGGDRPDIKPVAPPVVYLNQNEEPGSIIVDTKAHKLYYILPGKKAYEYPISVGRDGFTWTGTERISRIAAWPSWTPPPEMHQRMRGLPVTVTGGLLNPHGARALYLGNTIYRIHGTNNDRTVGRANSSGCFRLKNEHVVHLASIAKVGASVKVLQTYTGGVSESAPLSSLFSFASSEETAAAPANAKNKKPTASKAATAPVKKAAAN
jgi:lipoprotein-anchoring transpeptidase ErfK/SrfK